jgi:hypothetical protein
MVFWLDPGLRPGKRFLKEDAKRVEKNSVFNLV